MDGLPCPLLLCSCRTTECCDGGVRLTSMLPVFSRAHLLNGPSVLRPIASIRKRHRAMMIINSVMREEELGSDQATKRRGFLNQYAEESYAEVGIDNELYARTGGVRFRQHANPLKRELQVPTEPLPWDLVYDDPSLPLIVDVGAGYGRFLLALANKEQFSNCLGLEIREPAINRANTWAKHLQMDRRVKFVKANATVSFQHMLSSYPGPIELVTVQFPDPHFKKRHRKRRIIQPRLVTAIKELLSPGARVLIQSDVLEVAEDMREQFERGGDAFRLAPQHSKKDCVFYASTSDTIDVEGEDKWESIWAAGGWLLDNPLPVPTEREIHVTGQGLPVYRLLLLRQ